jgi:hypothetical protein
VGLSSLHELIMLDRHVTVASNALQIAGMRFFGFLFRPPCSRWACNTLPGNAWRGPRLL